MHSGFAEVEMHTLFHALSGEGRAPTGFCLSGTTFFHSSLLELS